MDRQIIYPGAIPLETDLAYAQVATMQALGYLAETTVGLATCFMGLTVLPTTPASMQVIQDRGVVFQDAATDTSTFSSIPANGAPIVKMGINTGSQFVPLAAPATTGQSQCFLFCAALSETDADPVVLNYYNASNPSQGWAGPGNNTLAQSTHRIQRANVQVVPGVAAPTGSQSIPSVPTGFVPTFVVTLAAGQTSITASSIALHPNAPVTQPNGLGTRAGRRIGGQRFLASGTYNPSPGTRMIRVRMIGAGGAGGGCQATTGSQCAAGGGGGSGAYLEAELTGGFAGVAVTVGAGGAPVGAGNGGNGGATTFAGLTAPGGSGGAVGSAQPGSIITNVGAGGAAPSGTGLTLGTDGNDGTNGLVLNGSANVCMSGQGGTGKLGSGGGNTTNGSGGAGRGYGAGGGGGAAQNGNATPQAGGAGAAGVVLIEEFT